MRALAELVMRGRMQACSIAFIGFAFPFVSSAVIGLVTLRKGSLEGFIVMLWAILPVLLSYFFSENNPYLAVVSGILVLTSLLVAVVLRMVSLWDWTLMAVVLISVFLTLMSGLFFKSELADFVQWVEEVFELSSAGDVLVLVTMGVAINALLGLMIARWWQALLYNQGGFQKEFHSLKLDKSVGAACLVLALIGLVSNNSFGVWLKLASIPLLICGIAFVHFTVKFLSLNKFWLFLMYVSMLFGTMSFILAGVGAADSFLNLRERLTKR